MIALLGQAGQRDVRPKSGTWTRPSSQQSLCAKGSRDLAARGPLTHGLRGAPIGGRAPPGRRTSYPLAGRFAFWHLETGPPAYPFCSRRRAAAGRERRTIEAPDFSSLRNRNTPVVISDDEGIARWRAANNQPTPIAILYSEADCLRVVHPFRRSQSMASNGDEPSVVQRIELLERRLLEAQMEIEALRRERLAAEQVQVRHGTSWWRPWKGSPSTYRAAYLSTSLDYHDSTGTGPNKIGELWDGRWPHASARLLAVTSRIDRTFVRVRSHELLQLARLGLSDEELQSHLDALEERSGRT